MLMTMKKTIVTILFAVLTLAGFTSCNDYLTQTNPAALSEEQAYSSAASITNIAANLYNRLRLWQSFSYDNNGGRGQQDLNSWDESTMSSEYYTYCTQTSPGYRSYYDYTLVRELNLHIQMLTEKATNISDAERKYFLAEARWLRAFTYFVMVENLGGVPLVTEVYEYTDDPLSYAKPRNTEAECYEFIADECDAIKDDLDVRPSGTNLVTRATKGAALALKSRAMLYAGTLAYNHDKSAAIGLNLSSGATGIPKAKANEYLKKCIDAYKELEAMGYYTLLTGTGEDYSENFSNIFTTKSPAANPELIFVKDYDGSNVANNFTYWNIPRTMRNVESWSSAANPTLNLVESYEMVTGGPAELDAYEGDEVYEYMIDGSTDKKYVVYDNPRDIFAGRDPRLAGTVILPWSNFRGTAIDMQAGLAVKTDKGYDLKVLDQIANFDSDANVYEGRQVSSKNGPFATEYYSGHSGFFLRKYLDPATGSELSGKSTIPYIVFRFGEILLNTAEAAFYLKELGETSYSGYSTAALALDCINRIRNRAGGPEFEINADRLDLNLIQNERRVELAFEDHRFNDLRRWRIAHVVWNGQQYSATAQMKSLWPYKIYAPGTEEDGKWLFRRVWTIHRGSTMGTSAVGAPIAFTPNMYYSSIPQNSGNPYIEKNPLH